MTETTTSERQLAILRIGREALRELLRLPPGARIIGLSEHVFFGTNDVAIKVEGGGLYAVREDGEVIPLSRPCFGDDGEICGWEGFRDG